MGGSWDATNVVDADGRRRAADRGRPRARTSATRRPTSRVEKAGIIKPGSVAVLAEQTPEVAAVLLERATEVGATVGPRGHRVRRRRPDAGGRRPDAVAAGPARALRRRVPAALRRPPGPERRRRAGRGRGVPRRRQPLDEDLVRAAFAEVTSPGRLEIVRRSPTIVLDAAHNPHGAEALGRGARGLLHVQPADRRDRRDGGQGPRAAARRPRAAPRARRLHPELHRPRRCPPSSWRASRARSSARTGSRSPPPRRRASSAAATLAEAGEAFGDAIGSGAVLVTGSVVTVGEARTLLEGRR